MPISKDPSSAAAVIAGKACIYCGYDLTGLSAQDVCPRCGKPAGYSLLGDHLRDVESTWLKEIVLGINVAVGAYIVLVGVRLMTLFSLIDPKAQLPEARDIRFFLALAGWLTFVVGVFFLTRPETSGSLIARRRGIANFLLASSILYGAYEFVPDHLIWQSVGDRGMIVSILISSVALVVSQSILWLHLRRSIIDRTPRREVARWLNRAFWISLVLFIVGSEGARLLLFQNVIAPGGLLAVNATVVGLMVLHHIGAAYLLLMTKKAIRRTVGYWDD